jgi:hypothetical protein
MKNSVNLLNQLRNKCSLLNVIQAKYKNLSHISQMIHYQIHFNMFYKFHLLETTSILLCKTIYKTWDKHWMT